MRTRQTIAAGLSALAVAGGAAAATASAANAATSHASAHTSVCSFASDRYSATYVPGVRIRTWHNLKSPVIAYAKPETPYVVDRCVTSGGAWYHACGLTSDKWVPVEVNGRWGWSARACWVPTVHL